MLYLLIKAALSGVVIAVASEVARRWPAWETFGNDICADGVALMAAGLDWLGEPLSVMPERNRQVLAKVVWPDREAVQPR